MRRKTHIGAKILQPHTIHHVHLKIMRPNIFVPKKTHLTVLSEARVPFRDLIMKILPKLVRLLLLRHTVRLWRNGQFGLGSCCRSGTPSRALATPATTTTASRTAPRRRARHHPPSGIREDRACVGICSVTTAISLRARSSILLASRPHSSVHRRTRRAHLPFVAVKERMKIIQRRISCTIRDPVNVRIPSWACLETCHRHKR